MDTIKTVKHCSRFFVQHQNFMLGFDIFISPNWNGVDLCPSPHAGLRATADILSVYCNINMEYCMAHVLLFRAVVGKLVTIAGRKRVVNFVVGLTNNYSKGTYNIHPWYICVPLGAWRAAQELITGCMRPAGRSLPTPGLEHWTHDQKVVGCSSHSSSLCWVPEQDSQPTLFLSTWKKLVSTY